MRSAQTKTPASRGRRSFSIGEAGLGAVLLDARRAQAGKAMAVDRVLPGEELCNGEGVAAAGFFQRQQAAADGGNNLSLTSDNPTLGARRWQVRNRQRTAIRPDDILDPRAVGFGHNVTHRLD